MMNLARKCYSLRIKQQPRNLSNSDRNVDARYDSHIISLLSSFLDVTDLVV